MLSPELVLSLNNPALLLDAGFINGKWVKLAINGATFDVTNPSTGAIIATLPDMGVAQTKDAIDAAYAAQDSWAKRTGKERGAVLRRLFDLMVANVDDLAAILTAEMGKPLEEAKGEVMYGAS